MSKRRKIVLVCALCMLIVLAVGGFFLWRAMFYDGGLSLDLDPAVIAAAETRMWRAYYAQAHYETAFELAKLLREQFGVSLKTAGYVGLDFSESAAAFAGASGNYHQQCMPGLVRGYERLRNAVDGDWDARDVARAELAWWIARRKPGQNSPENVGRLIAEQYALLYGATNPHIEEAGRLRAIAGAVRDKAGPNADWARVEELLRASYTELLKGVRPVA